MRAADRSTRRPRHYGGWLATTSTILFAAAVLLPVPVWADFIASVGASSTGFEAAAVTLPPVKSKIGLDRRDIVRAPATSPIASSMPPHASSLDVAAGFKHHDKLAKSMPATTVPVAAIPATMIAEPAVSGFEHHPNITEIKTAAEAPPIPAAIMLEDLTSKKLDIAQNFDEIVVPSTTVAPISNAIAPELHSQIIESSPVLDAVVAPLTTDNSSSDITVTQLPSPPHELAQALEAMVETSTIANTKSAATVGFQHSPVQMASLPPVPTAGMEVHFTRTDPSIGSFHVTPRSNHDAPTASAATPKTDANVPALADAGFAMSTPATKSESDAVARNEATTWAAQLQILERENQALRNKLQMNETDHLSDIKVDAVAKIHEEVLRDRVTQLEKELDKLSMQKDRVLPQKTGTPPAPPTPEQIPTLPPLRQQ